MKTVRFKLVGFWSNAVRLEDILPHRLFDEFDLIESERPDIVIFSSFGSIKMFSDYPEAVRVFYCGEPMAPDFIFFDYWIGSENMQYRPRYCYYPDFLTSFKMCNFSFDFVRDSNELAKIVSKKNRFCDYIQSHEDLMVPAKHCLN